MAEHVWIECSKRTPPEGVPVWALRDDGTVMVGALCDLGDEGLVWANCYGNVFGDAEHDDDYFVEYWAPIVRPIHGTRVVDPVSRFLGEVSAELARAREKFPGDRIMGLALAEEFGELIKALLDEPGKEVWKEAVQTATMAARVAIDGDGSIDEWRAAKGLDNHRQGGGDHGDA